MKRELYPEISDPRSEMLQVSDDHQIYVEVCGNPDGVPVIFLHGGPGSGCQAYHRQFFDPEKYRIILFDQRGCGRSTPKGCLTENTTLDLIEDMERIRAHFSIDRWVLFGGSWGVTLALLYAETYPDRVSAIILRGAFLAAKRDLDWFFGDGVSRLFPDEWQRFTHALEVEDFSKESIIKACHDGIHANDPERQLRVAKAWSRWTGKIVTWTLPPKNPKVENNAVPEKPAEQLIKEIALEIHYAFNRYFLRPEQLIEDIDQLPDVPITLIHGRRDITCPIESSWRLSQHLPKADFVVLEQAGHLASEADMVDALITATDQLSVSA